MKSKHVLLFLLFLIIGQKIIAQNNFFVLKIKVLDQKTNLEIKKAEIYFNKINKKIFTDKYGMTTIALPIGEQPFQITNEEYEPLNGNLLLSSDSSITFFLNPLSMGLSIDEIKIIAKSNKIEQKRTGQETITISEVLKMPVIGSEKDLLKTLVIIPGVAIGSEGSSDIFVRGGLTTQNLLLLDNFPLYNTNHIYGLISSFSPSIISEAVLYKSSFPARFGGRLSSVFDASSSNINLQKISFNSSISPLSIDATLSVPIIKNKSGLFLSTRRSFIDIFQRTFRFRKEINYFNFYNGLVKYTHLIDNKNTINFLFYIDSDNNIWEQEYNSYKNTDIFNYQNLSATFNLSTNFSKQISNKISLNITNFINNLSSELIDTVNYKMQFNTIIADFALKDNISLQPKNSYYSINAGFDITYHNFIPGRYISDEDSIEVQSIPNCKSLESAIYADFDFSFSKKLSAITGLRVSSYYVQNKDYLSFEPRLSLNYKLNDNNSFKLSFSRMTQPLHLITNPGLGMPITIWFSSDTIFRPQSSYQYVVSYNSKIKILKYDFLLNIEGYYKTLDNILDFVDGYSSNYFFKNFLPNDWHNVITNGFGKSYGVEFSVSQKTGRLNFQISYTLSWTFFMFDKLNNGKQFPASNDIRNNISTFFSYKISKNLDFGLSFFYMTGKPVTLPINYMFDISAYSQRNAYRMIDYHRMDVSFKWNIPSKNKKIKQSISFDIYNLYNRKNPYYYKINESIADPNNPNIRIIKLQSVSLFPIIPTLSYSIKF